MYIQQCNNLDSIDKFSFTNDPYESGVDEALRPGDLNLRREQSFLDRWAIFWGAVVLVQTFILRQRHQTVVPMRAARPVRFRRFLDAVQVLAET